MWPLRRPKNPDLFPIQELESILPNPVSHQVTSVHDDAYYSYHYCPFRRNNVRKGGCKTTRFYAQRGHLIEDATSIWTSLEKYKLAAQALSSPREMIAQWSALVSQATTLVDALSERERTRVLWAQAKEETDLLGLSGQDSHLEALAVSYRTIDKDIKAAIESLALASRTATEAAEAKDKADRAAAALARRGGVLPADGSAAALAAALACSVSAQTPSLERFTAELQGAVRALDTVL